MKIKIDNGTVINLPDRWKGVENIETGYKNRNDLHLQDGFYELVYNSINLATHKYGNKKDSVLTNQKYIVPIIALTQKEIDNNTQKVLDEDDSAKKNQRYLDDGIIDHKRFWDFVMRNYDDETIDDAELSEIGEILYAPTQPLTLGFWKIAQGLVNNIPVNSNSKINAAINKVKTGINNYIISNP